MLINTQGNVVKLGRCDNRLEEGFVVSAKGNLKTLLGLREVLEPAQHKCGDMFKLGTRGIFKHA